MSVPLALYIHWPFCKAKCPYCDFNSHVRERVDQERWKKALLREMETMASRTPGRTLTSIFFGGGTPSLMPPDTVAALIDQAQKHWTPVPDLEITLEANPTSVEAGRFAAYRQAGVNRVSLGIQALDDASLKFLGRQHNAAEAQGAIKLAAQHFDRFSFDLIYARPEQTVAAWSEELKRALDYAVGHLSVYQLTIEQGTQFHTLHARGDFKTPDDDQAGALYEATQDMLDKAGLPAYEISNHARPGQESRHNLAYWRYQDYAGIGPGAHGRLTLDGVKYATRTHRAPEEWLQRVEESGHGLTTEEAVDRKSRVTEMLMMGLRLREGISLARLTEEGGQPWALSVNEKAMGSLKEHGFAEQTDTHLIATATGRQRLNSLLEKLLG